MANEGLPAIENTELSINYGMNRLRFLTPVKSGERLRGRFVLREVAQKKDHQLLLTYDATVEIEGGEKPALVAEWLVLYVLLDA
jgi:acyl dehydratase